MISISYLPIIAQCLSTRQKASLSLQENKDSSFILSMSGSTVPSCAYIHLGDMDMLVGAEG